MADGEAYCIRDRRINIGSRVTLPKSWHARVSGDQDVPGTITVRVEWDAAVGRAAVVFAALDREGEGVDTSRMLREVRTHWIMTRPALDVVTVHVRRDVAGNCGRIPVREFLSRVQAKEESEPVESLCAPTAAIASRPQSAAPAQARVLISQDQSEHCHPPDDPSA
jgi:hypothetical protein